MDVGEPQRIVLYGGSFDPPHVAHLALPTLAAEAVGADAVWYLPAGQAPHKRGRAQTPAHHRLAMLRLALAPYPRCRILTDEIDRAADGRPSYTVDTLQVLRDRLGSGVVLRLLIGADMLRIFPQWREPERVVELAEPLVMVRPPDTREGMLDALPDSYNRETWSRRLVDLPRFEVSSTDIRARVALGRSIAGLVPVTVEDYIRQEGLYRDG